MIATQLLLSHQDSIALKLTDRYSVHRVVYDLFEDVRTESQKNESVTSGILYVDKGMKNHQREILILSDRPPRCPAHGKIQVQNLPDAFLSQQNYYFEVVVNPTKRDKVTSKTVAIQGREAIKKWFIGKTQKSCGFQVNPDTVIVEDIHADIFSKTAHTITMASAKIKGELEVCDQEAFKKQFRQGIGRGRAFGFGLLQVIPFKCTT